MAKGKYEYWLSENGLILLEGWARDGLTDEQIAHNMGIGYSTLQTWKSKFQDIQDALKKGKEVADYFVENAMFKSACGFFVEEAEDKIDMRGNVVPTTKRRYVPPSVSAQIFWLKNRRPDKWRDKPVEVENNTAEADAFNKLLAVIGKHDAD